MVRIIIAVTFTIAITGIVFGVFVVALSPVFE